MRQVFVYKKPDAQIEHISQTEQSFPASSWIFTRDEGYCFTFNRRDREVKIHRAGEINRN